MTFHIIHLCHTFCRERGCVLSFMLAMEHILSMELTLFLFPLLNKHQPHLLDILVGFSTQMLLDVELLISFQKLEKVRLSSFKDVLAVVIELDQVVCIIQVTYLFLETRVIHVICQHRADSLEFLDRLNYCNQT